MNADWKRCPYVDAADASVSLGTPYTIGSERTMKASLQGKFQVSVVKVMLYTLNGEYIWL